MCIYVLEVYQYIGLAKYQLPIWQKFQYQQSVFFEIVPIFLPTYICTSTIGLILFNALFICDHYFSGCVIILQDFLLFCWCCMLAMVYVQ